MAGRWIITDNGKTIASFESYAEAIECWKKMHGKPVRLSFLGYNKSEAIRSILEAMPTASNKEIKVRLRGAGINASEGYIRSIRSRRGMNMGARVARAEAITLPSAPEQRLEHAEETIKRRRQPIRRVVKTTIEAAKMVDLETAKDLLTSAGSLEAAITALKIVSKLKS